MPRAKVRLELIRPKQGSAHDRPCHPGCLLQSPDGQLTCGAYVVRRAGDKVPGRHACCRLSRDSSSTDSPSPNSLPLGSPIVPATTGPGIATAQQLQQPQGMWHGEPDIAQPPPAAGAGPRPILLEEAVASRNRDRSRGYSGRHVADWADGAQHPVPLGEAVAARRRKKGRKGGRKSKKRGGGTVWVKCCCMC